MWSDRVVQGVMLAGAGFFLVTGTWALVDPSSFYDQVATFPPYNRHFLHDVGAFQLGLGAALVLGLTSWSGRVVALWAVAVASVLHTISHVIDSDLGGRSSDPVLLSLAAAAFIAAALLATRKEVRRHPTGSPRAGLRAPASQGAPQQD
jgi:hypothetical protein